MDFAVILSVVCVAQIGLIAASAVAICLAILLFIRDQIRGSVILNKVNLQGARSKRRRLLAETAILEQQADKAAVIQWQGNLFFRHGRSTVFRVRTGTEPMPLSAAGFAPCAIDGFHCGALI